MPGVNLLAISIGNTRTKIGTFVDGHLVEMAAHDNPDLTAIQHAIESTHKRVMAGEGGAVMMGSVEPRQAATVEKFLRKQLKETVQRVERDLPVPIGRQLDPEAIVGEDRLLNAAAAYDVMQQACVVVDAGTAITIDFIDGAGTFHGGAIAPGGQMMLNALHHRTAQLPEIEFDKPVEPIGHSTIEAMRAGAFYGLRGIVRELVERIAEEAGQYPMVVATGGDANLLFRDWDAVDRVVPDLTLMGLAVTLRKALEAGTASGGTRGDGDTS